MFEKDKMKVPQLQELNGISKNTLYAIYNNNATKVDLSNRLYAALNYQPGDLLEYMPTNTKEGESY